MLSIFPQILFLSPFGALLLRVAAAIIFALASWAHSRRSDLPSRAIAVGEIAVAILLFVGAWTQPAALLGAIIAAIWYFQPSSRVASVGTILLTLAIVLSLLVTGPGAYAFDLPL